MWGDHDRFIDTYFTMYDDKYFTGDGCRKDEDGDYWLMGRIDDVVNVSGHRIGTAEVESALVSHDAVAEAAVVGHPTRYQGTGVIRLCNRASGCGKERRAHQRIDESRTQRNWTDFTT